MANISNIVNVTLLPEGAAAAADNMNVCAIITSEQGGSVSTANRYELYTDAASVASDFGSAAAISSYANTFFGTKPNPVNAGGVLVVGYWRGASETVAASAAKLTGAQLTEVTVIDALQSISAGSFDITIDGATEENITGLDFRTATTLEDVVALIDAELSGGTATLDGTRIVITSSTTGATSTITLVSTGATGTFVGGILGLATGTGAVLTQGVASAVLSAETQVAAITALKALVNIKGAMFIDAAADSVREDLAEWAQANSVLMYDVFDDADYLEKDVTNIVWAIKLAGLKNYRMLYSAANNRKMAATYMARTHTVNFNAENSAMTMHLKELTVPAEVYSQTVITKAKDVGLDIYTTTKDVPIVLTSGANGFVDDQYNLIGFVDAVQVGQFNLLKLSSTKVPQTTPGVNKQVDQAEKDCSRFVRAGVFAPGAWSNPDTFGDLDTFNRSIEQNGFYVLAGLLKDQPQEDRQARKSPVLQVAVKNAGAIHSADVIINFNA